MQTWDGLRLGLLAHGYRLVKFCQFNCPRHGDWRAGTELECEYYSCPSCQRSCPTTFLAEGFTKRELPFLEQTERPTPLGMLAFWKDLDAFHRRRAVAVSKSRRMAASISVSS